MKKILLVGILFTSLLSNAQTRNWSEHVEIVRDSFGVPHIFGKTDADVGYGLGWATCEDDFKTLQWGLNAGKGLAGRSMGKDGAMIDFAVQLLRVREMVSERYEIDLSPHVRGVLEAMTAAVNKYASMHPEEVLVKQAFPASPKDIVAGYVLSYTLLSGIDGPLKNIIAGKQPTVPFAENGKGSNGIAFNSAKTKDGNVYLDINSHQPLEGPLSWYEIHLCSEEGWNIMGGTFHGGATVFHGVNEYLGWAHTVNNFDAVDVFQLQPDPKKKDHYLIDGISYALETGKAKLHVNLAKKGKFVLPVSKKIWWSKYGATLKTKKGWFAVKLGATSNVKTIEQYFQMNKAKNYTEFRTALDMQGAAMMTVVYGDKYDTIYCLSNALAPVRNPAYDWQNTVPGNTMKTLWTDYHPESDLPQVLNPKSGYVFNFNNSAFDCTAPAENPDSNAYDKTMGFGTKPTNRSLRFHELMEQYNSKIDWEDFKTIKYDEQYAKRMVFFKDYSIDDIFNLDASKYPDLKEELATIKNWSRKAEVADTNYALIYKTLWYLYNNSNDDSVKSFQNSTDLRVSFFVKALREVKIEMMRDFGTIHIPLGDLQRLTRGDKDIAVGGGPDVIRAAYPQPYKDGKFRVFVGESYILLVKFTKDGPEVHSVSPYGASNKPDSKHYTDQMDMYVNKQTKKMTFDKAEIYKKAEQIYHPK